MLCETTITVRLGCLGLDIRTNLVLGLGLKLFHIRTNKDFYVKITKCELQLLDSGVLTENVRTVQYAGSCGRKSVQIEVCKIF